MIDWSMAERVAVSVAGSVPTGRLASDLSERAEEIAVRVCRYADLTPAGALPLPEPVSRREWITANHDTMRPLLDPVADRMRRTWPAHPSLDGAARALSGRLLGAQVGLLTGYLARRVLGQYELSLLDPERAPRLLLVAPNLHASAIELGVDGDDLLTWVTAHELTHAVQFGSVPWLRDHLAGLLQNLLDSVTIELDGGSLLRFSSSDRLRRIVSAARARQFMRLILGPERHALVERVQATMSLIEGHAEHVMDAVGAELLPSLPQLRAALSRRRSERPPIWRVVERLLGLEMKLRQYEEGRRFCDEVVRRAGIEGLNRAWEDPQTLPTPSELRDPAAWLERCRAAPTAA